MKKLKLNVAQLLDVEILSREVLKNVLGGNTPTTSGYCEYPDNPWSCEELVYNYETYGYVWVTTFVCAPNNPGGCISTVNG